MKRLINSIILFILFIAFSVTSSLASNQETFLVHLKTSLKKDDAQICVAYNVIWAALKKGYEVKVLVDADAINTFKTGWGGKDDIEEYKIPDNLRQELADQFKVPIDSVPKTYGDYLTMLKKEGAEFYINQAFLLVSKIGTRENLLEKVSAKFFKPISLEEMVEMRSQAKHFMAY
jgi:predicted peroxiredoxin